MSRLRFSFFPFILLFFVAFHILFFWFSFRQFQQTAQKEIRNLQAQLETLSTVTARETWRHTLHNAGLLWEIFKTAPPQPESQGTTAFSKVGGAAVHLLVLSNKGLVQNAPLSEHPEAFSNTSSLQAWVSALPSESQEGWAKVEEKVLVYRRNKDDGLLLFLLDQPTLEKLSPSPLKGLVLLQEKNGASYLIGEKTDLVQEITGEPPTLKIEDMDWKGEPLEPLPLPGIQQAWFFSPPAPPQAFSILSQKTFRFSLLSLLFLDGLFLFFHRKKLSKFASHLRKWRSQGLEDPIPQAKVRDDFSVLERELEETRRALSAREKTAVLTGKKIPPAVAEKWLAGEKPLPLQGERLHAFLFAVELGGFQDMLPRLAPAQVTELLQSYFSAVTREVERFQGFHAAFRGNIYLALFGLPGENISPEKVFAAAQSAKNALNLLQDLRRKKGLPLLNPSFFLHAGEVFFGDFGCETSPELTVLGPTVEEIEKILRLLSPMKLWASRRFFEKLEKKPENSKAVILNDPNTYTVYEIPLET